MAILCLCLVELVSQFVKNLDLNIAWGPTEQLSQVAVPETKYSKIVADNMSSTTLQFRGKK